ncbi:MAG TPA: PAS domain S-box protein [Longimicrobiales bacterium]|nr:PAS domain S-box protein [Longimicrobiales bacterium]
MATLLALLVLPSIPVAIWAARADRLSTTELHVLVEGLSAFLALMAGILSLVRYYSKRDLAFLYIGAGFLATAFFDLLHAVAAFGVPEGTFGPHTGLLTWSWTASRLFLAGLLCLGWWRWRTEGEREAVGANRDRRVYYTVVALGALTLVGLLWLPLPTGYRPGAFIPRPGDLAPGLLFLLALFGHVADRRWQRESFFFWLVAALALSMLSELGFLIFAERPSDLSFDLGHGYKVVSYALVLVGLFSRVYQSFRQVEEDSRILVSTNDALQQEVAARRQVEAELRQLSLVASRAHNAVVITDAQGRVEWVNRSFTRMTGYPLEEIKGKTPGAFLQGPLTDADTVARMSTAVGRHQGFREEVLNYTRKGIPYWVAIDVTPVFGEGGALQQFIAIESDVTERRQSEDALRESEERLQDFLDSANDLIQSTSPDGAFLYVNRAWRETLGYDDAEVADLNLFDILSPRSADDAMEAFRRVADGESLRDLELTFLSKYGREVEVVGSANCRFENGLPVATQAILRDVTEKRRAEAAFRTSQANISALIENASSPIWSVNRHYKLIAFNVPFARQFQALYGIQPREGEGFADLLPMGAREYWLDLYDRALAGERFSVEQSSDTGSGRRHFVVSFNPIRGDGGLTGVTVYSQEITDRIRAEGDMRKAKEEAEEASRAKSRFLANMSHELRTPLNSVIGFTNVVMKNKAGNLRPQDTTYLERIRENGRHLLDLINDILDLSKVEAGRMEMEPAPVDVGALVREVTRQLEAQVADRPVELVAEVPERVAIVDTDRGKLKQVLINLVGNALKFTDEGSVRVIVRTDSHARPRALEVVDTGIGIPPARLAAIFEAFQQADTSTTRKYGGTGLGLTISRSLCRLMGYDLEVESREGDGSTFRVVMADAPTPSPTSAPAGAGAAAEDRGG